VQEVQLTQEPSISPFQSRIPAVPPQPASADAAEPVSSNGNDSRFGGGWAQVGAPEAQPAALDEAAVQRSAAEQAQAQQHADTQQYLYLDGVDLPGGEAENEAANTPKGELHPVCLTCLRKLLKHSGQQLQHLTACHRSRSCLVSIFHVTLLELAVWFCGQSLCCDDTQCMQYTSCCCCLHCSGPVGEQQMYQSESIPCTALQRNDGNMSAQEPVSANQVDIGLTGGAGDTQAATPLQAPQEEQKQKKFAKCCCCVIM